MAPHKNEHNEYELLVHKNNHLVTRIIDRTFEENYQLWSIDFKTGKEDLKNQEQYRKQLNEYAHHLSKRSSSSIQCGLYYLANNHWISWAYDYERHNQDSSMSTATEL